MISGEGGRAFCAGADLIEFGTAPSQVAAHRSRRSRDVWGLLAGVRKPLVAAMHGYVIGAGVEDRLPVRRAYSLGRRGLRDARGDDRHDPGGGRHADPAARDRPGPGHGAVPRRAGRQDDRPPGPSRAGLVHDVVPRERLDGAAMAAAREIAAREPAVMAAIKTAVLDGLDAGLGAGLDLEAAAGGRAVNVSDLLSIPAAIVPDRAATVFEGRRTSYSELDARAGALAAGLASRAGVRPGDRVAWMDTNGDRQIEAVFGVARAGAVSVPVNYRARDDELAFVLEDSGARVLCVGPRYADAVARFMRSGPARRAPSRPWWPSARGAGGMDGLRRPRRAGRRRGAGPGGGGPRHDPVHGGHDRATPRG